MAESRDEKYMNQALVLAEQAYNLGEVPVGAVVVYGDKIIGAAHNLCEQNKDRCAHGEVLALSQAAQVLKENEWSGAELYVTLEPCPMCAGALWLRRIGRVVYGALDNRAGGVHSLFNILTHPHLNHHVQVTGGVLEMECRDLLQKFFRELRGKQR